MDIKSSNFRQKKEDNHYFINLKRGNGSNWPKSQTPCLCLDGLQGYGSGVYQESYGGAWRFVNLFEFSICFGINKWISSDLSRSHIVLWASDSFSCCMTRFLFRFTTQTDVLIISFGILWYHSEVVVSLITASRPLLSRPVPDAANQVQTLIPPPPCFTDVMRFFFSPNTTLLI